VYVICTAAYVLYHRPWLPLFCGPRCKPRCEGSECRVSKSLPRVNLAAGSTCLSGAVQSFSAFLRPRFQQAHHKALKKSILSFLDFFYGTKPSALSSRTRNKGTTPRDLQSLILILTTMVWGI